MPEAPLTPEEKLLRIIETPQDALRPMKPRRQLQDAGLLLKLFKEKYWKQAAEKVREHMTVKAVNVFLIAVSLAATVYLALDLPLGAPRSSILAHIQNSSRHFDVGDLAMEVLSPLSIFMQEITQRDIFSLADAGPRQETTAAPSQPQTPEAPRTAMLETLKLVGIIWSDAPQAIIEDIQAGRTYLVNRGGKAGQARVKDILKDRVVLSYDNQDIELR